MKDRNVQFPNRYRLQKVAGTDDIVDLIPAPGEITAEGTLLNKGTLLSDPTAAALGLSGDPTVNDALRKAAQAAYITQAGGEPIYTPVALRDIPVGKILKINENGSPVDYYVAQHGYPTAGNGRTLVRRTSIINSSQQFGNSTTAPYNEYAGGGVDVYLNETFLASLDMSIQNQISTVNIPYTPGGAGASVSSLQRKIFIESVTETGLSGAAPANVNIEGAKLALYSSGISVTTGLGGNAWTRSPVTNGNSEAYYINPSAAVVVASDSRLSQYYVPMFTLPSSMQWYTDGARFYSEQQYTEIYPAAADALGNIIGGFARVQIGSYTGTGTYGASNPSSLTFDFTPKTVIIDYGYVWNQMILTRPSEYACILGPGESRYQSRVTWGENSVSWYNTTNASYQLNNTVIYYYTVLG